MLLKWDIFPWGEVCSRTLTFAEKGDRHIEVANKPEEIVDEDMNRRINHPGEALALILGVGPLRFHPLLGCPK